MSKKARQELRLGHVTEVKEEDRGNGIKVGLIKGHIATWDVDRGDIFGERDQFVKGAFSDSLNDFREKGRNIRFKDHHGRTVGIFPIGTVQEDEIGLFGVAEVNLEVQQGAEVFALAKQGALTDFSIGFTADESDRDEDIRRITKATIWEGSIVDEPMNPHARVTEVKVAVPFQDLPLADRERAWDADAAIARLRDFTNSTEEPSTSYREGFVWYDRTDAENFGAYKLPIADVIDGRLVAVPRGIFAAAAALQGARGGVDIPDEDLAGVISHLERYYAKMDLPSPFDEDDKRYYILEEVKEWTARDLENLLKKSGLVSKNAAKYLASGDFRTSKEEGSEVSLKDVLIELEQMKERFVTA